MTQCRKKGLSNPYPVGPSARSRWPSSIRAAAVLLAVPLSPRANREVTLGWSARSCRQPPRGAHSAAARSARSRSIAAAPPARRPRPRTPHRHRIRRPCPPSGCCRSTAEPPGPHHGSGVPRAGRRALRRLWSSPPPGHPRVNRVAQMSGSIGPNSSGSAIPKKARPLASIPWMRCASDPAST